MRKQKTTESAETLRKSSQWKDVWIRLRRNKLAMVGMVIAVLLALMAISPTKRSINRPSTI